MKRFSPLLHYLRPMRGKRAAFSLVETVLAIGIVAFGLVSLLGLMPAGLSAFRSAMDSTIRSEIMGQVVSDLRQTDPATQGTRFLYFSAQAEALKTKEGALYYVNISPVTASSSSGNTASTLRRILVEIVKNPSGNALQRDGDGRVVKSPNMQVWSHPVFLSPGTI